MLGNIRSADVTFWMFAAIFAFICGVAVATLGYGMLAPFAALLVLVLAAKAWRKVGKDFAQIAPQAAAPNILLIALPTVIASATLSLSVGLYLTAITTVLSIWMRPPRSAASLTWLCLIFPAAGAAIALRANYPGTTLSVLMFLLCCFVVVRATLLSDSKVTALVSLVDGLGLFLVTSIALWFAGLSGAGARTAGLDNALIGGQRVVFPLSSSLSATPAMAAVYLASAIPILIMVRRYRAARLVAVGCAFAIFVLGDARAALLTALLLAAAVLLVPRAFRVAAPWVVGGAMAVPFAYSYLQDAVGQVVVLISSWAPQLLRAGEQASTLNRRDYIWSQSVSYYQDRVSWIDQIFGFGAFGHAESGASSYYYRDFGGLGRDDSLMTPHNSLLQLLFDGGWLIAGGLAITMVWMAILLAHRARSSQVSLAALAMLVALSIVSITEVTASPGHALPTWWALLALSVIVFARERDGEHSTPALPAKLVTAQAYWRVPTE